VVESESSLIAGSEPADPAEMVMTISTGELMEVLGGKGLQLRAKFELISEKVGELPPGKAVHVVEQKMTEDGKTRMAVIAEGDMSILGWLTGSAADGKKNLKVVGRPVLQVVAAKALVARAECDLFPKTAKRLVRAQGTRSPKRGRTSSAHGLSTDAASCARELQLGSPRWSSSKTRGGKRTTNKLKRKLRTVMTVI
jgi:hypothetical protein